MITSAHKVLQDLLLTYSHVLCFLSYLCTASGKGMTVETGVISKQALFYVLTII